MANLEIDVVCPHYQLTPESCLRPTSWSELMLQWSIRKLKIWKKSSPAVRSMALLVCFRAAHAFLLLQTQISKSAFLTVKFVLSIYCSLNSWPSQVGLHPQDPDPIRPPSDGVRFALFE